MSKKQQPFHNPFAGAKERLKQVVKVEPPATKKPSHAPAAAPPATAKPPSDERLFDDEMRGVMPLAADPRGRISAPEAATTPRRPSQAAREDAESYAQLADLVDGEGHFDIADSDEFIEGLAPGLDRRILKRLRKGDYALQGHVDLHGLTRDEARAAVERFLTESRDNGRRCVLIIHGRGSHSKDQIPVLKERVKVWLERGRIARLVLAFATARPCDGGAGAVYVLLRR